MSKIQSIQSNHRLQKNFDSQSSSANFANKQSFGTAENKTLDDVCKYIANKVIKKENNSFSRPLSKFGKWVNNVLANHDGEIQTQLINAFFTTTLAPLMIWKNPFSKKDEKTRKYSALRQPVSAGIALSGGLAMTIAVNKYLDKICSEGDISTIEGRLEPTNKYLKSMFKKEMKSFNKDSEKINEFLSKHSPSIYEFEGKKFNDDGTPTGKYIKACMEKYAENTHAAREKLFTNLIGANPEDIKLDIDPKTKESIISITKKTAENVAEKPEEIGRNIPKIKTKDDLDKYIDGNNINRKSLKNILTNDYGIETYTEGVLTGQIKGSSIARLKEAKGIDLLKKLGIIGDKVKYDGNVIDDAALKKLLEYTDEGNISALKLLQKSGIDVTKNSDILDYNIKQVIDTVLTKFKNVAGDKLTISDNSIDFAKHIVKGMKSRIATDAKQFKGFAGIIINLPMTAITCTLLNILYPKFVDAFFPHLSKKTPVPAEMKGGNK